MMVKMVNWSMYLTASRIASPKTDPHPLGLVDVQGQLDGDEQQGNN